MLPSTESAQYNFHEENDMEYYRLSDYLKNTFGQKVYKISLSSGCSCPTRDGKLSFGGCSFCSEGGSGEFAAPVLSIDQQIALAKEKVDAKFPSSITKSERKYIAYFQSFTNTYGDPKYLEKIFLETLKHKEIVALSIATRPDCISDEMMEILDKLNRIKPIWIELGLQTIHETTAIAFNRAYPLSVFEDCYQKLKQRKITVIVHVILGLPEESEEMMYQTIDYLTNLTPRLDGIKLQLLHILKGTRLAKQYQAKPFKILSEDEYCHIVVHCLKRLSPEIVVHRITGDGPKKLLIAPLWSANKKQVLNHLTQEIKNATR